MRTVGGPSGGGSDGLLLGGYAKAGPSADVVALCRSDVNSVETAAQAYSNQTVAWPPSVAALTRATAAGGPWLREVPGDAHYTIFLDPWTGEIYVYPPRASRPTSYTRAHDFAWGDPCATFAS